MGSQLGTNSAFECGEKEDTPDKPYVHGDRVNYFEDSTVFTGFIDVLNCDTDFTYSDVRIVDGNLLVRPGISTVQELQVEKELFVCKRADFQDDVIMEAKLEVEDEQYNHNNIRCDQIVYAAAFITQTTTGGTGNGKFVGNLDIDGDIINVTDVNINGTATGDFSGTFNGTINQQSWKSFDIKHPNKKGWRLRHVCIEGPEAAVYIRGKLDGENIIDLPPYWKNLVDYDSITVDLTPYGRPDPTLYVKDIREEQNDIIVSSSAFLRDIKAYYTVTASRLGSLVVEYEGESVDDYPGDPTNFTYQG